MSNNMDDKKNYGRWILEISGWLRTIVAAVLHFDG